MVVPLACTYCRQKTELLGFSLAGDWVLTVVWCVMLNPLAFNYKIHVQKIPERGRGEEKNSHFDAHGDKVFGHLLFHVSWKMKQKSGHRISSMLWHWMWLSGGLGTCWVHGQTWSSNLNDKMILCLWTIISFFEKALLLFLLFLPIPTNAYFLGYLSWAIFIFTFIFT